MRACSSSAPVGASGAALYKPRPCLMRLSPGNATVLAARRGPQATSRTNIGNREHIVSHHLRDSLSPAASALHVVGDTRATLSALFSASL